MKKGKRRRRLPREIGGLSYLFVYVSISEPHDAKMLLLPLRLMMMMGGGRSEGARDREARDCRISSGLVVDMRPPWCCCS